MNNPSREKLQELRAAVVRLEEQKQQRGIERLFNKYPHLHDAVTSFLKLGRTISSEAFMNFHKVNKEEQ